MGFLIFGFFLFLSFLMYLLKTNQSTSFLQHHDDIAVSIRDAVKKELPELSMIKKVNLKEKLGRFQEQWNPKIVGALNDSYVKLVKVQGEFVWHHHDDEDEMFLVVKGKLRIKLRDQDIRLDEGEFVIIPKGVEHMPVAEEEAHILLLEPKTTLNTGNVRSERTREKLEEF
jgi:mannose-6-phosphate isomerase-like protein (cupin superfamily)